MQKIKILVCLQNKKKSTDNFSFILWSHDNFFLILRSRDNFLDEPEASTLKPRSNNRRRILKRTEDKKKVGEYLKMHKGGASWEILQIFCMTWKF